MQEVLQGGNYVLQKSNEMFKTILGGNDIDNTHHKLKLQKMAETAYTAFSLVRSVSNALP